MLEVVNDAFDLSSQVGVTLAEKMRVCKTWARMLIDVIPETELLDVFDFAFARHTSSFPISAYDLKTAYADFTAEKNAAKAKIADEVKKENPSLFCPNRRNHEPGEDVAVVKIVDRFDLRLDVLAPCLDCRETAYRQWNERYLAAHNGKAVQTLILHNAAVTAIAKPLPEKHRTPTARIDLSAEKCSTCGKEIKSACVRLGANFAVCADCDGEVQKLRNDQK